MAPNDNIVTNNDNKGDGIKIRTQTAVNNEPELTLTKQECQQLDAVFRAMMMMIAI